LSFQEDSSRAGFWSTGAADSLTRVNRKSSHHGNCG
jgi:hypothetical protein